MSFILSKMVGRIKGINMKGNKMQIKELIKLTNAGDIIPVTVVKRKFPAVKINGMTSLNAGVFPKKNILILKGYDYNSYVYIDYVGRDGLRKTFNLPNDFEVTLAEGEIKQSIMNAYIKYKHMNMETFIVERGFYIGSDPEIFVTNKENELIPAFNFLDKKSGATHNTIHLNQANYGKGSSVYWDGFQAEFETRANSCLAYHVDSVQQGLAATLAYARSYNKEAKLSLNTVMTIPEQLLRDSKPEHVALGCMPSMNAYGLEVNLPNGAELPFRSTGGHIHFGVGKLPKETYDSMVKSMDAIIGVACVSLFASHDIPARRQYYGLPGEYRTPPHGLEYRTLSNAWLSHPMINHLVFDIARRALVIGKHGFLDKLWKHDEAETIRIIRECDVEAARKVLTDNKDNFLKIITVAYQSQPIPKEYYEVIYNIFMNGMGSVIKDVHDIEGNWHLTNGMWQVHTGNVNATITSFINNVAKEKKAA
jgi:hypothetical protein